MRSIGSRDFARRGGFSSSTPPSASTSNTALARLPLVATWGVGMAESPWTPRSASAPRRCRARANADGGRNATRRCAPGRRLERLAVTVHWPSSRRAESQRTSSAGTPRSLKRSSARLPRVCSAAGAADRAPPDAPDRVGARGADDAGAGLVGDVLALGEDRTLEPLHLLDGPSGAVRDLLGRQPGADERLHVAWPQAPIDLDLQLAQPGPVATRGSTHRLVEGHAVALALGVGRRTCSPSSWTPMRRRSCISELPGCGQVTLDCATPDPCDKAAHAGREQRSVAR